MNQTVIIQEQLLRDLKKSVEQNNKISHIKLKLDVAVFYLSLLNSIPSFYREGNCERDCSIALYSKKLLSYNWRYSEYINFLIEQGFIIKVSNYGVDIGACNHYHIAAEYYNSEVINYTITDKTLLKAIKRTDYKENEKSFNKREYCMQKRPHLIKFFDDELEIDEVKALEIINPLLKQGEVRKYTSARHLINEFKYKDWQYSVKPDTDNRLHSSMTRLNKILRPCITYNGERLGSIDIKSSQPYFFCVILKAIMNQDKDLLKQIGATKLLNNKHIQRLFNLTLDKEEIDNFINLVINGDFYEYFSSILQIKYNEEDEPYRVVSNFSSKNKWFAQPTRTIIFKSKRDLAKNVVMEIFFSKPKTTIPEAKNFKQEFPSVFKVMSHIKDIGVSFDGLLTNVESYCLLDCVAKEFSEEYPDIPLFSIHDSLVTTQKHLTKLKNNVEIQLTNITTLKTTLIREHY
ncbi:hypothetical protein LF887_13905 [Chryseobacterium sp. MEBOG06]|uniref:hypothetical protein n=1 Tax=Chryseobacterium sp. MEBOG06 TaxID=2879938 RepID=UPI001F450289|nr:hypothetical protein [Chryseobacterium sp. MEBOG06]UKB82101.1 hypothetical protein LF887_13905 [Chryseobacterium sp. MEBOG06]